MSGPILAALRARKAAGGMVEGSGLNQDQKMPLRFGPVIYVSYPSRSTFATRRRPAPVEEG